MDLLKKSPVLKVRMYSWSFFFFYYFLNKLKKLKNKYIVHKYKNEMTCKWEQKGLTL